MTLSFYLASIGLNGLYEMNCSICARMNIFYVYPLLFRIGCIGKCPNFFDYHRQHNVRIKVIRIFNTYGPRMAQHDGRVVSNFIMQALRGEDITIYGDGKQTRSFQYVSDLVEGMIRMMESGDDFTGPVNIGNPGEFTMLELAEKVIEFTGSKSKIVFEPLPQDDPKMRRPDITLAKEKLDWEPKVKLDEGLKKTIEYFKTTI